MVCQWLLLDMISQQVNALSPGAWIVTGGTATGVMEFVGEAVQDHIQASGSADGNECVALGIASWGAVANNLALDGEGVSCLVFKLSGTVWGCSSAGGASKWHAADTGSVLWCSQGFFSLRQLSVQTP